MDEEITKILEDEIGKKVEESLNTYDIIEEMHSKIDEVLQKLVNDITLQLQKEKEDKIIEGL